MASNTVLIQHAYACMTNFLQPGSIHFCCLDTDVQGVLQIRPQFQNKISQKQISIEIGGKRFEY